MVEKRNIMKVTKETIDHVADMVKLSLTEKDKAQLTKDLNSIVSYMDTMNDIDTDEVEGMTHVLPMKNLFRQDMLKSSSDREEILRNAPSHKDGSFQVPKAVD